MRVRKGEVWWVSFERSVGSEMQKTRPAIVVSNNAANTKLNRAVVVPLTSKTAQVYPGQALINLGGKQHKAMADQITTASELRFRNQLGSLSPADLGSVENAVVQHLGIRR